MKRNVTVIATKLFKNININKKSNTTVIPKNCSSKFTGKGMGRLYLQNLMGVNKVNGKVM